MLQSRREAGKRKSRLSILAASKRLFKERGYENTMIEDVADEAQVSKATIYNYFASKESLLAGALDEEIAASLVFIDNLDESLNGYEKIRETLVYQIVKGRAYVDISRRMMFLNGEEGSPLYRKMDAVLERFETLVEEGKQQNIFRKEISTESIVTLINSFYLNMQFGWRNLENLTEQQCIEQITYLLDLTLAGCLVEK